MPSLERDAVCVLFFVFDLNCFAGLVRGSGVVGEVLDKLLDVGLEPRLSDQSDLKAEVTQNPPQIVLACYRLRLQKLAMR
jgi:hypothetical protein